MHLRQVWVYIAGMATTTASKRRQRGPWGADAYFSAALAAALLTGVLCLITSSDKSTAVVVAYAGGVVVGVMLLIGGVAKGVEAGIRAARD